MDGESFRQLDYRVFEAKMDEPNAIAIPGGGIGVTPALLEVAKSDAGLAFVLAHELGHHQHRHILRRMGRGLLIGIVSAVVFGGDGVQAVDAAHRFASASYSRGQEAAADEFALRLVHRKFDDTTKVLEFLEHMEQHSSAALERLSGSHPLTKERISALKKLDLKLRSETRK
jgi:beta-barrel assembly-enhancing protease